jgi:hypothetical protein
MTSSDGDTEKASNMSYFRPALLKTESEEDFEKLSDELKRDVQPAPGIELIYTHDFAVLTWEIIRYTRNKAGIINNAFRTALASILQPLVLPPAPGLAYPEHSRHLNAQKTAWDWFLSQEVKDRVSGLLEEAGLDIRAVEAEALRLSLDDIERVDRLLTAAEARRDKVLRSIAWYRECFAKKLQKSSERILATEEVPSIVSSDLAN